MYKSILDAQPLLCAQVPTNTFSSELQAGYLLDPWGEIRLLQTDLLCTFSYPRIRNAFLWWGRKCVEKINVTGKRVLPSTDLAFPWEYAPFILSASPAPKAVLNSTYTRLWVITKEAGDWILALRDPGKIINLHHIYVHIRVPDNALHTTRKCQG